MYKARLAALTIGSLALLSSLSGCVFVIGDTDALADDRHSKYGSHLSKHHDRKSGDMESVNGGLQLDDGAHAGSLESINGSIRLGNDVRVRAIEAINGRVRAGERLHVEASIETVNGAIKLAKGSFVGGSIESVNGRIWLDHTHVQGMVKSVNSDLDTGSGSHLRHGIRYHKPGRWLGNLGPTPRIVIGANTVVEGPMNFEREVQLYIHRSARTGAISGAVPEFFDGERPNG